MDLQLPASAHALGTWLKAEVLGDPEVMVDRLSGLQDAGVGSLSYLAEAAYFERVKSVRQAVFLIRTADELPADRQEGSAYLVVPDPKRAFVKIATHLFQTEKPVGISPLAQVAAEAELAPDVYVGPFAVIEKGAKIGTGSVIHPFCHIGPRVVIGENSVCHSHVVVMERVLIGSRVKIFPGAVIGSDGFGLLQGEGTDSLLVEIPQVGNVIIEDDVRIGAKCTIDRATLGETRICRGAKIDDQVHVGHNTVVGPGSILCAQSGLSGSVTLGRGVVLGGQAGVADHVTVGDGARMGGQTGTGIDLPGGKDYFLSPAIPLFSALKVVKVWHRLPELEKRLGRLEKRMGEGESKE